MLLYIHIPFCDSKCFYCSFNSYTTKHHLKDEYIDALLKQLKYELKRFDVKSFESIFIGGGTPSTLKSKYYKKIFKTIEPFIDSDIEITIEANPNSATKEWLKDIKDIGVNRVSFGAQSFNDEKLRFLGRAHSSKDTIKAVYNAKDIGFENISIDLIYDCSIDTKKMVEADIKMALNLPINHISTYALTLEENTLFFKKRWVKKDDDDLAYFVANLIKDRFIQYEVSNFGIYFSKHNIGYWQHKDYIGVGSGAVGFLKDKRFYTKSSLEDYIKNPFNTETENLSKKDLLIEKIFLGLRAIFGIDMKILDTKILKRVDILKSEGKIYEKKGKIYNKNLFLADEIALFLIE